MSRSADLQACWSSLGVGRAVLVSDPGGSGAEYEMNGISCF